MTSTTTIDLSGFNLEGHVWEALELAWSSAAGAPLSAAGLLSAAASVGGSEAFQELRRRAPGWTGRRPLPRGTTDTRPPSWDLTRVPVELPLAQSFSIAEPHLTRGDRRIWGRDFISLALWTPNDPVLVNAAEAAALDYEELRTGWLRFLLDSDLHRSPDEWQGWFDKTEGLLRLSLNQLSARATDVLASAEMSRLARGASRIHNEDLLVGLYARPDAPLRLLFRSRELDDADLIAAVLPDGSGATAPVKPHLLIGDPLTAWPALSGHAAEALRLASTYVRSSESTVIDAAHLLRGALSVPECSAVAGVARLGIHAGDVPRPEREDVRFLADEPVGLDQSSGDVLKPTAPHAVRRCCRPRGQLRVVRRVLRR